MKRIFALLLGFLFSIQLFAQNKTVTGRVTDNAGAPLSNVSVQVKGGGVGTTTDIEGRFSLSVPTNASTLVFTYSGMAAREVNITNETTVNVALQGQSQSMEEVVVVGYGTQRRSEVTGNVASISGNKLRDQPIQSFEQGLSGRAAGVNINIPNGVKAPG